MLSKGRRSKMKKVILFALILAVHGVLLNSVLDQEKERYLVTYAQSTKAGGNVQLQSATVVTVVNQSSVSCNVRVAWFDSSFPVTPFLVCTENATIDPGGVLQFCSRD